MLWASMKIHQQIDEEFQRDLDWDFGNALNRHPDHVLGPNILLGIANSMLNAKHHNSQNRASHTCVQNETAS